MNSKYITIPPIIHQVWSNKNISIPNIFQILAETWKENYPNWKYCLWDEKKMNLFVQTYYPQYWRAYQKFPYNIQRCDVIRYLILYKIGGMYVDFDYESLSSIEPLIEGKSCCFSEEPITHKGFFEYTMQHYFNNAMILSVPKHPFIKKIIHSVFSTEINKYDIHRHDYVLRTTGPWKLMSLYYHLSEQEKQDIYLIPKEYVTPFDIYQTRRFLEQGERSEELEACLKDAYAVHYFFSSWSKEIK